MVSVSYYNLAGGINQSLTKTELGCDTKKLFWTDAKNIEIYKSRGIIKQAGNIEFINLSEEGGITGLAQMSSDITSKLVITTETGNIFVYDKSTLKLNKLTKVLTGKHPQFEKFLNGMLIMTESDGLIFIKNNSNFEVVDCNLKDDDGNTVVNGALAVFNGRVWVASESKIYYSALGTYNDFETENDAGYIKDFHTNTDSITALKTYKDFLAIYKKQAIYLLSGTTQEDFSIKPFCDIGTESPNSIVNVQNKQYFLSAGIFPLEEIGELNQIQLGSDISTNMKNEFDKFDITRLKYAFALHFEKKNQVWYYFPYLANSSYNTIWINDYVNKSWYKRVIPQELKCACIYDNEIYFGDSSGIIYKENSGNTFNGEIIDFLWKSPFLSVTNPYHKKIIDEFYFVIDDEHDNKFKFSVFKDYASEIPDDEDKIYSIQPDYLMWYENDFDENSQCCWGKEDDSGPLWAINRETLEKAEISGSNYSIQLCIEGDSITSNCAIIGLEFREIYNDD